jgi:hypothetical protein
VRVAGIALLVLASSAPPAAANTRAWPGRVVGYRDLTGPHGYHHAIEGAVAAWNALRIGIRFVAAPPGASSVQIVFVAGRCVSGVGGSSPSGFQRFGARIVVRSCPAVVRPLLVAHELGRVLGLPNDDRGCSLMNSRGATDGVSYAVPRGCVGRGSPGWLPRLIDPATTARARAIYRAPAPVARLELTASVPPRIEWRQPRDTRAVRTVVARTAGRCPSARDIAAGTATVVYARRGFAGLHWVVDAQVGGSQGSYCYRVFNLNAHGRATPSRGLTYVVAPPPVASFSFAPAAPTAGAAVAFSDTSTDPAGTIVRWRWEFGDPASGSADVVDTGDPALGRAPQHTYAAPGSYTVTLTVVDDHGRSTTASVTIQVGGG